MFFGHLAAHVVDRDRGTRFDPAVGEDGGERQRRHLRGLRAAAKKRMRLQA
jgi:hypothetical protein